MGLLGRYKKESLIVNEAKQVGTLYYICSVDEYFGIIASKKKIIPSRGYVNRQPGRSDNNFVYFTRDKGFAPDLNKAPASYWECPCGSTCIIRLVIDGDKLSEHYRVRSHNDLYNPETGEAEWDNGKLLGHEEVVEGTIKDLYKYVKEVNFDFLTLYIEDLQYFYYDGGPWYISWIPFNKKWKQKRTVILEDGKTEVSMEELTRVRYTGKWRIDPYIREGETIDSIVEDGYDRIHRVFIGSDWKHHTDDDEEF